MRNVDIELSDQKLKSEDIDALGAKHFRIEWNEFVEGIVNLVFTNAYGQDASERLTKEHLNKLIPFEENRPCVFFNLIDKSKNVKFKVIRIF